MSDVIDLRLERARRGLKIVRAPALEPEPPPGYRRGDKVMLRYSGQHGTVLSHRWRAEGERLALRLIVVTQTGAHAVGAEHVIPLPATSEVPHG